MEVTLLGTGDTTGTPTVGCDCETCQRACALGVERSRFSVHIRNPRTDESLLVDASPDFRQQFLEHEMPLPDAVVITHIHFDHLDGLGNMYRLRRSLPVYASATLDEATGESVAETVERAYGYLDALSVRPTRAFEPFDACGFSLRLLPVNHPPHDSYGLLVEDPSTGGTFGMTGDTNFDIPEQSLAQLRGVDLLLADAIVPGSFCRDHPAGGGHVDREGVPRTFGSKHMTREGALEVAEAVRPANLRLVHMSHCYPVEEAFEEPLAVDGERYTV